MSKLGKKPIIIPKDTKIKLESGRLFLNLREDKGFTYGAYSFFMGEKQTGMFGIQTSVKTEVTDSALAEIFSILDNYTNTGLTDDELNSTKESFLNSASMKYETPNEKFGFLNLSHLTFDFSVIRAFTNTIGIPLFLI